MCFPLDTSRPLTPTRPGWGGSPGFGGDNECFPASPKGHRAPQHPPGHGHKPRKEAWPLANRSSPGGKPGHLYSRERALTGHRPSSTLLCAKRGDGGMIKATERT